MASNTPTYEEKIDALAVKSANAEQVQQAAELTETLEILEPIVSDVSDLLVKIKMVTQKLPLQMRGVQQLHQTLNIIEHVFLKTYGEMLAEKNGVQNDPPEPAV